MAGALLYLGDGHAVQGDGEVAGTGLEIAMKVRLQVDLIKKKRIRWPRFETGEELMVWAPTVRSTTRCASRSRS